MQLPKELIWVALGAIILCGIILGRLTKGRVDPDAKFFSTGLGIGFVLAEIIFFFRFP